MAGYDPKKRRARPEPEPAPAGDAPIDTLLRSPPSNRAGPAVERVVAAPGAGDGIHRNLALALIGMILLLWLLGRRRSKSDR